MGFYAYCLKEDLILRLCKEPVWLLFCENKYAVFELAKTKSILGLFSAKFVSLYHYLFMIFSTLKQYEELQGFLFNIRVKILQYDTKALFSWSPTVERSFWLGNSGAVQWAQPLARPYPRALLSHARSSRACVRFCSCASSSHAPTSLKSDGYLVRARTGRRDGRQKTDNLRAMSFTVFFSSFLSTIHTQRYLYYRTHAYSAWVFAKVIVANEMTAFKIECSRSLPLHNFFIRAKLERRVHHRTPKA